MGGAGGGGLFSQRAPAWDGSPGTFSTAKEELVEFGPLYGNLESLPSGFIIIMEDDTPDVLIRDTEGGNQQGRVGAVLLVCPMRTETRIQLVDCWRQIV